MENIDIVKYMVAQDPQLKELIKRELFDEKELTRRQRNTIKQQAIISASGSWMPPFIK